MKGPRIHQRGPHWFNTWVSCGKDPRTGKRRRFCLSGGSREEVLRKYKAFQAALGRGIRQRPAKVSFGAYLLDWLDASEERLEPSTLYGYRKTVRRVCDAPLGGVPLADLTVDDLEAYYKAEQQRGLGPNGLRAQHRVLRAALRRAGKRGLIAGDPAFQAELPKAAPYDVAIYDSEQLRLFLGEAKRTSRYYLLYLVAATCGLRQSELLGARWQDLAPDGTFHVRQAFVRVPGVPPERHFKAPKTTRSRRAVVIDEPVMALLQEHRAAQQRERTAQGAAYCDGDLIFCQANGKALHGQNLVERDYKPILRRAGLPPIPFQNLRHSHLSHLERQGTPLSVISERAGHADPGTTMRRYVRPTPDQQRDAARGTSADLGLSS
jgi:integrase